MGKTGGRSALPLRLGAMMTAVTLLVAACSGTPGRVPRPTVKRTTTVKASATPKPIPSLGLLLEGRVTVDPGAMLTGKVARVSERGVTIISNNGSGILSDNGLGIIANNGGGILSDNGLGYRVAQSTSTMKPVEGMWVKAISLADGSLLAGPVATDADGRYKLGFIQAPKQNILIVPAVPGKEAEPAFSYPTLARPAVTSIETTDSTRALAAYILSVVPHHLQPFVDLAKAGTPYEPQPADSPTERAMAQLIAKIPIDRLIAADKDGAVSRGISERVVARADLSLPIYDEFSADVEEMRAFGATLSPQPDPPLMDRYNALLRRTGGLRELPELLESLGMPQPEAKDLGKRIWRKSNDIGQALLLTLALHQAEVVAPLEKLAE